MIKATSSAREDNRLDPSDMRKIRAAEMYCFELEGLHFDDVSSIYKITRSHVYAEIRAIPEEVKRLIETSPTRDRIGDILHMVRNRPGAAESRAKDHPKQTARRDTARHLYRLKASGRSIDQIAAEHGMTRRSVLALLRDLAESDRRAIDREGKRR